MTQERYQEAAEWHRKRFKHLREYLDYANPPANHPQRKRIELEIRSHETSADVFSKLTSGWVLVPGNAIAEVRNNNLYWLVDDSYEVTDGPLYAAAPKP